MPRRLSDKVKIGREPEIFMKDLRAPDLKVVINKNKITRVRHYGDTAFFILSEKARAKLSNKDCNEISITNLKTKNLIAIVIRNRTTEVKRYGETLFYMMSIVSYEKLKKPGVGK